MAFFLQTFAQIGMNMGFSMNKETYILTMVIPSKGKSISTFITKPRVVTFLMAISALYFMIYFPVMETAKTRMMKKELNAAKEENATMRQALFGWQNRIKNAETFLVALKNKYDILTEDTISIAAPYIKGMGGIEDDPLLDIVDPDRDEPSYDISLLEKDIDQFKTQVLEISSRLADKREILDHYPSIRPVSGGWISSVFGFRQDPFTRQVENHKGLDISIKMNTPVHASADGIVKKVNSEVIRNKGYGKYIVVDHGYGFQTLYAHLNDVKVKEGQKISRWDVIGLSGNSGKSTGPHLHYGVYQNGREKDPTHYILHE